MIVGTRPQFIKLAPFVRESKGLLDLLIMDTGQHYDHAMSTDLIREFGTRKPDYFLNVGSASHGLQTGRMLGRLDAILSQEKPDLVVVFGDTNSTLAGALAASKLEIPVVHIEAGMRSNDLKMPEEINRRMVDSISSLMFCPTRTAMDNLIREGRGQLAILTGDIMVDSLDYSLRKASESSILEDNQLESIEYIYTTLHRPANTDSPENLKAILGAVGEAGILTILPIHPRTEQRLKDFNLMGHVPNNLKIIPPIGHFSSIQLVKHARCVLTDSGGVQKEAYLLGTPCITLRESTEWPETLYHNRNRLVKIDKDSIRKAIFESHERFFLPTHAVFGEPGVSKRMIEIIRSWGAAL